MTQAETNPRVDFRTGRIVSNEEVAPDAPLRTDPKTGAYEGRKAGGKIRAGSRPQGKRGKEEKPPRPPGITRASSTPKKAAKRASSELRSVSADGSMALRGEAEGDGLTIEGVAVRYDTPTRPGATAEFPGMREAFAPGSFADVLAARGERPFPIIDEHDGTVVGSAVLVDGPDALRYRGRLLTSQAARDFAERVRAGVVSPSIEFLIGAVKRAGDTIVHTRVEALGGIAGTYKPAYTGTTFAVRREGSTMKHCEHCGAELALAPCQCDGALDARAHASEGEGEAKRSHAGHAARGMVIPTTDDIRRIAIEATEEVMRRQAGAVATGTDPLGDLRSYRSLGDLMYAAARADATSELRSYAARALADQLTTDTNTGVTSLNTLTSNIAGIVSRGRRAITAFGGPRPLPDAPGMSATWPYFDGTLSALIGVQATQKTEITSVKVQLKQGSEPIQTFAGGSDIAFQLIERSDPSYLEAYGRIMLLAYAVVTDAAFVTELESGTTTGDTAEPIGTVDATELLGLLVDASIAVETATGAPADFVLASTTAFTAAAKLFTPTPVSNARGSLDLPGLQVSAGGLPVIHVPSITAGKFIVSNQLAAGWYEAGPFQISATDVAKLGQDVAYWGMGVPARFIPAGIIEVYDVVP